MNTPLPSWYLVRVSAIAVSVLLLSATLSGKALAQASQTTPSTTPSVNDASELEVDGQPPSVSAPTSSEPSDTPDQIDIDVQQRSTWNEQQQELQQEQEQEVENAPDGPPSGSDAPGQDSPDRIEIPL